MAKIYKGLVLKIGYETNSLTRTNHAAAGMDWECEHVSRVSRMAPKIRTAN